MKKNLIFLIVLCGALLFTGCKSKESAYKLAYEKAKAAEVEEEIVDIPEVEPMVEIPVVEETVVVSDEDSEQFRTEELSIVDGDNLKNYSVVVGSFTLLANAEGLESTLRAEGFSPRLGRNEERGMYRVIATTFDTRGEAIASRDELRRRFPDAWLLYQR